MRYPIILLTLTLLFLTACGGPTLMECIEEHNQTLMDACPSCPACAVCEECEPCDECPDPEPCPAMECEVEGNRVELSLDDLELYKTESGPTSDVLVAKYDLDEIQQLESAWLFFVAECDEAPGLLRIELEEELVEEFEPACNEPLDLKLDPSLLDYGRNTFTLTTLGDVDYTLNNIFLYTTYENGTNETEELYSISFTPEERERQEFKSLSDASIKNYVEYEVSLKQADLDEDLLLSFDGDDREGLLLVLVNEELLFSGEIERRLNEIVIPKKELRRGTNYITFVGVSR